MNSKLLFSMATALGVLVSPQAHAQYVTATYTGTIDGATIDPDGTGPDGKYLFTAGEPINYTVTFDPSKLVDHTASANASIAKFSNPISFSSFFTASLSDDSGSSLMITIGNEVFTKFDQANYGTPRSDTKIDLGSGNFPVVEYINGSFAGVGGVFFNSDGGELYTDPVAALRNAFDGDSFYVEKDFDDGSYSDAEGNFNIKAAVFSSAVPEPASWMMMIAGFGLLGFFLRYRARKSPVSA